MKRVWILLAALVSPGCQASRGRDDARAVVAAYRSFQEASAIDRPAALKALAAARCNDAAACADRDACVDYASKLVRAEDLAKRARALSSEDAGGSGAATPEELSVIVAGPDDAVRAAETTEPSCRAALSRLYALASSH